MRDLATDQHRDHKLDLVQDYIDDMKQKNQTFETKAKKITESFGESYNERMTDNDRENIAQKKEVDENKRGKIHSARQAYEGEMQEAKHIYDEKVKAAKAKFDTVVRNSEDEHRKGSMQCDKDYTTTKADLECQYSYQKAYQEAMQHCIKTVEQQIEAGYIKDAKSEQELLQKMLKTAEDGRATVTSESPTFHQNTTHTFEGGDTGC